MASMEERLADMDIRVNHLEWGAEAQEKKIDSILELMGTQSTVTGKIKRRMDSVLWVGSGALGALIAHYFGFFEAIKAFFT